MAALICNLPSVEVWVRKEYLTDHQSGHGEFVKGVWVSAKSIPGRTFYFETYLPEYAAMYDKLPISAFLSSPALPDPDMDLPNLQFWNCMDYGVVSVTKQFIGSMDYELYTRDFGTQKGTYICTLDNYHQDPDVIDYATSENPAEHKSHNLIELDNGQYALYPNNRMRIFDNSLTPVNPKMPDFKVSTQYYQVENGFERLGMGREDEYFWKTAKEREPEEKPTEEKPTDSIEFPGLYTVLDDSRDALEYVLGTDYLDEESRRALETNVNRVKHSIKQLTDFNRSRLPKRLRDFNWGNAADNERFKRTIENENFIDNVYQKFFSVEEGDIVFDVGASVGPFTHLVKDQNPEKIYSFEPHPDLYKDLVENVQDDNVVLIDKAIGPVDGSFETCGLFDAVLNATCSDENIHTVPSVKFSTFIKENNITRIDFLKSDCEGGEYDIFNDENLDWIRNNVRKIAGEWHLSTPEQKEKFKKFRDTYLRAFPKFEIESIDYVDMKWALWEDWFVDGYILVNLYIDNR